MKTTLRSSITFLFLLSVTLFATASTGFGPTKTLRKEVAKLVHAPELMKHGIYQAVASIEFTVNEENEVQLLEVETLFPYLKSFIEERLADRKLTTEGLEAGTVYTLDILFQTEEQV